MIVTISGPPGSGTSTLSNVITDYFNLAYISSGDMFRAMAKERGVSLEEFGHMAQADPAIDKQIDGHQVEVSKNGDDLLFEGRLSGRFIDAELKIMLKTDIKVRARRIAQRENISFEQAMQETLTRQESEAKRYREFYDIDISDLSPYDLVIESSVWNPEATAQLAITAIRSMKKKGLRD
ncbi:cytidylate kinase [Candidatus Methanomarinus sp.]|nr:cytidylate kinase [ANME-2 cluster archaeon]